jgi:hypothetical protein
MATPKTPKTPTTPPATRVSEGVLLGETPTKQVVGSPDDVARFQVGDLVQCHLFFKGEFFDETPHGDVGTVHSLSHEDETHIYHMPVVLHATGLRMWNPEFLIVTQYLNPRNGADGEADRLALAEKQIADHLAKQAEQAKLATEA